MYKGYKGRLMELNKSLIVDKSLKEKNKLVSSLAHITKCSKCQKLNPSLHSPAFNNIQNCLFCGNPFYIIKSK